MITTVTLNPSIDREYFVENHIPGNNKYIYDHKNRKVTPGGKGLIAAINLKRLGYSHVQNIGFVGGRQGMFFEKMVQEFKAGNVRVAREKNEQLQEIFNAMFMTTNPIPVKSALNLAGHEVGTVRPPLLELDENSKSKLKNILMENSLS
jgi:hypothetical protein